MEPLEMVVDKARVVAAGDAAQLFSAAFHASGVGMALTDLDGVVTRANPALCAMLGRDESTLAGRKARAFIAAEDLDDVREALAGLYLKSDPSVVTLDLRVVRRDRTMVPVRLTASLVRVDGEPRHVLLHLVDVTGELRARSILESEHERLSVIIEAQRQIANTEVDMDRLLTVLSERTVALTGAGAVAVLLPENGQMVTKAVAGTIDVPIGFSLPIDGSLAGLAFRTGEIQRASNARKDERVHKVTARTAGLGAMVSAPLVTERGVVGVLQLVSEEPGGLDDTDARTLQMIAGFAAAAFERAGAARRLRDSERRVRAVIESGPYPIVVFTPEGEIVDFNPAAERAFARPRSEVVGGSVLSLLSHKHVDAFYRWSRAGNEANSAEYAGRLFEATGVRSDGTEFPMEIVITDLHEETRLIAAFLRDLTLRNAQRESEAKSRLMAMMNHEVRTPLNSILGFARLLKASPSDGLNRRQRRYVDNIEVSGNHLLELVNDSLDLATLDTGHAQIHVTDVGVDAVMEQAGNQMRPLAEARGLSLHVVSSGALVARADRRQLVQVLLNLLSNAIRHTHEGGSVTLEARGLEEDVLVSVTDTGDGISCEDQTRLFEEFFQAGNHAPGGIGLGLAISRRLARQMHADIEVQSELGRGSTFTVRLGKSTGVVGAPVSVARRPNV